MFTPYVLIIYLFIQKDSNKDKMKRLYSSFPLNYLTSWDSPFVSIKNVRTYFDIIPRELLEIIFSQADRTTGENLSSISSYISDIYYDKWTWIRILSGIHPRLYQLIKDIREDTIENMKYVYYFYQEDAFFELKILLETSIDNNIDKYTHFFEYKSQKFKILFHMAVKSDWPGIYDRLISLSVDEISFDELEVLKPYRDWRSIIDSLIYSQTFESDLVTEYLKTGNLLKGFPEGGYPNLTDLDLYLNVNIPNIFNQDNYVFIWLYFTDRNVDINDESNGIFIVFLCDLAVKLDQRIENIISRLNDENIDRLHFAFNLTPSVHTSKREAVIEELYRIIPR